MNRSIPNMTNYIEISYQVSNTRSVFLLHQASIPDLYPIVNLSRIEMKSSPCHSIGPSFCVNTRRSDCQWCASESTSEKMKVVGWWIEPTHAVGKPIKLIQNSLKNPEIAIIEGFEISFICMNEPNWEMAGLARRIAWDRKTSRSLRALGTDSWALNSQIEPKEISSGKVGNVGLAEKKRPPSYYF
jgi:hypothetical protein